MNNNRKKLLYISSILPDTSCGAHIAIYRHFVIKEDFDVAVCSYMPEAALTKDKFKIKRYRFLRRFFNSRFSRVACNIEYLINWYWLPPSLYKYAKEFRPDAIFTVPDNMHSGIAYQLAKKLDLPLITNFQDLFPISRFIARFMEPYPWVRRFLMSKFFKLHRESSLVFYTSEGMKLFFGERGNAHVLYPVGDFNIAKLPLDTSRKENHARLKVIYAGNCYGAYGRMLLEFAKRVKESNSIHLKIFPVGKGWSDDEIIEMKAAGIYQDFLPFEKLKEEFAAADAFLTVMSFEKDESPFVKTSFTTKWLDYAPYGKPIFVWGPEYSSGVIFAKKYNSGIVVSDSNAVRLEEAILQTRRDANLWATYGENARSASENILNAEIIHSTLVAAVDHTLGKTSFKRDLVVA
jgi:hypothetical protein